MRPAANENEDIENRFLSLSTEEKASVISHGVAFLEAFKMVVK